MKLNYIQRYFADVTVGASLSLDSGDAKKSMREFKQEIKSAKEELLNVQEAFGATSKEALNAAKKVAQLQDALQDANETAKLFDPGNKFQAIGNAVRGLTGGFSALQGVMALVGVEGDNVQKMLLKVQSALALTEGLNVIADVGKDFQRLGSILTQTLGKNGLIGVAIAGVAALTLAMSGIFTSKQRADVEAYNDTLKDYQQAAGNARKSVIEVQAAFDLARKGVISKEQALKTYNDTLGDSLGRTKNLNEAEKLLADKAETYIKVTALKAQANALFAKAAERTADALVKQDELGKNKLIKKGGFTEVLYDKLKSDIQESLDGAKEIEKLGTDLLSQAAQLSTSVGISSGAKAAPASPAAKVKDDSKKDELEKEKRWQDEYNSIQFQAERQRQEQAAIDAAARISQQEEDQRYLAEMSASMEMDQTLTQSEQAGLRKAIAQDEAEAKIALAEQERAARVQAAQDIGNAFGALSDLVGRQTAAGKALGIAQAIINTWIGVSEVLRAKSVLPEPIGTIAKIANVATIVATGINAVKNIAKVQVPGGGGGGGTGSLNASAPLTPQPQVATTQLDQRQLNQIGNATVRAFVVESDVTSGQERVRRLNRAARL